ncbi:hypothetical protein [Mangrovibacterium diazotrophicum]|nr:hypothetical protein [Mangrovibacterium diazotrophicum]
MIKSCLIAALLLLTLSGFCQTKKDSESYVITIDGDTIYGVLKKRSEIDMCKGIRFYSNQDPSIESRYTAADLEGFYLGSKDLSYRSFTNEKVIGGFSKEYDGFWKLLFDGELSLYKLSLPPQELDGIKRYVYAYMLQTDTASFLLTNSVAVKKKEQEFFVSANQSFTNVKTFHGVKNEYLRILNYAFQDCDEVCLKLARVGFNDDELTQIVKDYVDCKQTKRR